MKATFQSSLIALATLGTIFWCAPWASAGEVTTSGTDASNRVAALVKSERIATLASQIDGVISSVDFKVGDSFSSGDILLSIDCTLPNAALNKAKAQVEYARNEFRSQKALEKLNSSTKALVARAAAEFATASADLEMAVYQSDQCELKAPFDGTVVQSWVMPFETVNAKTDLLRIVNNEDLSVEFMVSSDHLRVLAPGDSFKLTINETGRHYELQIDKIIPMVDSVSRTIKVISRLDNPEEGLWAGMSGWAALQ